MRTRDTQKEQSIREHAIKMVVEEGIRGLSMQKLAKAAGVSPATIYIYYKDRDDLIVKITAEESQKHFEAMLEGFDPATSFEEGLRVQWRNRAKYCLADPLLLEFMEIIKHTPYRDKAMQSVDRSFMYAMREFVHNNIMRGEVMPIRPEVYWSVAFAPLYQLVRFQVAGKSMGGEPFQLTDEMLEQTLQLVLKALRPTPQTSQP